MRLLLVALVVVLSGCASSQAPAPVATTPPATTPAASATPTPAEKAPDEVVYLYERNFTDATQHLNESFTVAKGHWLCFVTNVTAAKGDALVTVEAPDGGGWFTLAATPSKLDADEMVPWTGQAFVVHLNLTGFSGRIALNVTSEA